MELTKIQKLAVDHVETKVADLWKKILILANNAEHEDEDATKYRMLCMPSVRSLNVNWILLRN